ncbi:RNA polymerase sigma factor [Tenuifilum thalassicum]|uniref:Sigma-70 family RNA polymerase sigma factor n=1 Tax=Tenuifilum thalassicum TaxID=2590900 RepID=A0A7D4BKQ9_9BACT|nr:sigma-70 family RNA polymerase sigma factor [Tenuifilum thalassicum]QKG80379.1 sigma-70 family RNA polymerase sigma factor [Tenuifilum thalassicum]
MDISKKLVERCRQGDNKAQFELYKLYSDAMYNVSCRVIPDTMEAEDAMQEAFFKAFDKIDTFRGEVTFGAWLKRIVVNTCLDHLKRKKVLTVSLDETPGLSDDVSDEVDYDPESVEEVKQALNKLPEGYKLVLSLRLIDGYEYEEIATMMGIAQSTVRSQYVRAKRKLVELLKNKI